MEIRSWWRDAAFAARARLPWARAPRARRPRPLARDLRGLTGQARARAERLAERYPAIASWSRWLDPLELQEGLYLLEALSEMLPGDDLRGAMSARAALDVGSKNGMHLPALHALCPCPWTLVEVDGHRRYGNLVTRRSRGEQIARAHAGSRFLVGSVRDLSPASLSPFRLRRWAFRIAAPGR